MLEHAKMTLGLVYELGFTDFNVLEEKVDGETINEEL
jgi:leucyl aminopeptidase